MKLILLPGNSIDNKSWIAEVAKNFSDLFDGVIVQNYKHWEMGKEVIDFEHELDVLKETIEDLNNKNTQYAVFGKSAGTLLTLRAVSEIGFNPVNAMFTGVAWRWAKKLGLDLGYLVSKYKIPTVVVQKTNDPAISFTDLKKEIESLGSNNFYFEEIPGSNHHYEDIKGLKSLYKQFLSKLN